MNRKSAYGLALLAAFTLTVMPADAADEAAFRADMEIRLMEMENRLREVTGQYEEAMYRLNQMSRTLERTLGDVEYRLQQLEGGASLAATPAPAVPGQVDAFGNAGLADPGDETGQPGVAPVEATPDGAAGDQTVDVAAVDAAAVEAPAFDPGPSPESNPEQFLTGDTPEQQFRNAFTLLRRDEFIPAEQSLRAFLVLYPDHPYTPNAKYWLGKSYYARGDYTNAARVLVDGYEKYANSDKGPDILLHLALSLEQLGQTDEACSALTELSDRYPEAPENIMRRAASGRQSAGCG